MSIKIGLMPCATRVGPICSLVFSYTDQYSHARYGGPLSRQSSSRHDCADWSGVTLAAHGIRPIFACRPFSNTKMFYFRQALTCMDTHDI